jgi:hypothetical protein
MVAITLEFMQPWKVRNVRFGREPGAGNEKSGTRLAAISLDHPLPGVVVKARTGNPRVEVDIFAKAHFDVDVSEVAAQFLRSWKALAPSPVLPQ